HYACDCQKPRVRDANYFREQILLAIKDEAESNLKDEENDFMLDNSYGDVTLEELTAALGIESYQIKVNLTTPTLTFLGFEAHDMYSIVDKPATGLIYLNNKNEKWVMYLVEIVKFCDAMLEKVLKEVKLRTFQIKFWKKLPLLDEKVRIICEWKTNSIDDEASIIINP
nr:hypothetical protein [Tanacetum cinerariifolium]